MNGRMRRLWLKALEAFYPKKAVCMGCGSAAGFERDWLCEDCREELAKRWIGARYEPGLDGMAAAYHYGGPASGLVRHLKYGGVTALAEPMADRMLEAYRRILPTGAEVVTFVPMHPKRIRRRGFNQAEVLAEQIAERLGLPCEQLLERTRNSVQQARLEGEARRRNLRGAFRATRPLGGTRVLLVDDVFTTGATARECARTLREGGAANVYFVCFAASGD